MFWTVFVFTLLILILAFAAIGIKMFVKKDGRFERRCENEGTAHCVCGGKGGEDYKHCPNR
jgi:hypothetical protein